MEPHNVMGLSRFSSALVAGVLALFAVPATADVFVDANLGSDTLGLGTSAAPFRSITHALSVVSSPDTIQLGPGLYGAPTGEVYPLVVPDGVNLVDSSLTQAAWIRGSKNVPGPGSPVIQIDHATGFAGLGNVLSGFGIQAGSWGVLYESSNTNTPVTIEIAHVRIQGTSLGGVKVDVLRQRNLHLVCRDVKIRFGENGYGSALYPVDSIRVKAQSAELTVALSKCTLAGLATGIYLTANTGDKGSVIDVAMDGVILNGNNMAGLVTVAEAGSSVRTTQNHCVYYHIGFPVNPWHAAIVDDQATAGISHDIRQTIFNSNNTDFQDYAPARYTLAGNVYHKQGPGDMPLTGAIPGGINTSDPGFVQPGADFHLRESAVARDQTLALLPDFLGGDLDGEFAAGTLPICFDNMIDAGPDEYRAFTLYSRLGLALGETDKWRGVGPELAAGPLPWMALLFAGAAGVESACPTGFELDLALPAFFFGAVALDATGVAEFLISVPADPSLVGLEVTGQCVFVDLNNLATGFSRLVHRVIAG